MTRSQIELVRSSLEDANSANMRRRIGRKRTVIPPQHLALPATVDPVNLPEIVQRIPEALESSEGDTKKRRLESFDELVDWCQRERSSMARLTNSSEERDIF